MQGQVRNGLGGASPRTRMPTSRPYTTWGSAATASPGAQLLPRAPHQVPGATMLRLGPGRSQITVYGDSPQARSDMRATVTALASKFSADRGPDVRPLSLFRAACFAACYSQVFG